MCSGKKKKEKKIQPTSERPSASKKIRQHTIYPYVRVYILQQNEQDRKRRKKKGKETTMHYPLNAHTQTYTMNERRIFLFLLLLFPTNISLLSVDSRVQQFISTIFFFLLLSARFKIGRRRRVRKNDCLMATYVLSLVAFSLSNMHSEQTFQTKKRMSMCNNKKKKQRFTYSINVLDNGTRSTFNCCRRFSTCFCSVILSIEKY